MVSTNQGDITGLQPFKGEYDLPEDYKPYIPVKKRRAILLNHLGSKHSATKKLRTEEELQLEQKVLRTLEEEEQRAKETARKERTLLQAAQEVKEKQAQQGMSLSR